jgi:hypothetical protein
MDNDLFKVFINWNTGLLCLGVYLVTYVIRTVIEALWGDRIKASKLWNKLWNELFLPIGPIVAGALLGLLAKKFPLPTPIADSIMAKLMYGGVCGVLSGWLYARLRGLLKPAADPSAPDPLMAAVVAAPAAPAAPQKP